MSTPSAGTAQLYQYSYDEKNQLASTVLGYDWSYDYDDIGNRLTVTVSGAESDYTVNAVNQYTQREVPRLMRFRGLAHPDAVVTLTEDAVTSGALLQVDRLSGEAFWLGEADYEGGAAANDRRAADFTIEGILAGAGHGGSNAVAESNVSGLLKPNPESFTYDDDGNLTRDAYWDYSWDGENRLIVMEHRADLESFFDQNGLERKRLEFIYDSQSRRVQKKVFYRDTINNAWVSQESRRFLYDGWNPLVELVSTGSLYAVERTYLWGLDIAEQGGSPTRGGPVGTQAGGVGGLLAIYSENAKTTLLPTYDGHGSIMTLVDAASGANVADYEYGPFGELLRATGPLASENPFGYSTKYTDTESGLVYYGYRYYVPETGRWLNRDPIEENGGVNLYGFVGNDGVGNWDLLGQDYIDRTCCTEKKIEEGEKELKKRYIEIFKKMKNDNVPHKGKDEFSCDGVNSYVFNNLGNVPCWKCNMENRKRRFIRADHWVVVCVAEDKSGREIKEVLFDYWMPRPPGEDPDVWFRDTYPKFKGNKLPKSYTFSCSSDTNDWWSEVPNRMNPYEDLYNQGGGGYE